MIHVIGNEICCGTESNQPYCKLIPASLFLENIIDGVLFTPLAVIVLASSPSPQQI